MTKHFLKHARRIVVAVIGFTVLLIGVVLLVLPGPAFIVIPAGLAILALEFAWAKRWLWHVKQAAKKGRGLFRSTPESRHHEGEIEGPAGRPHGTICTGRTRWR
jgi:uncharacterized protein (TIGR02611 family)